MRKLRLLLLPVLGIAIFSMMVGCEMPWESDDDDDPIGNSTIQGKVADFVETTASAKIASGIKVYIEGPVNKSTTTGDDGIFIFSGLPEGTYTLRFELNGEEVRYRGNSGQEAQITLQADQRVELTGITISGGAVNIGNIKVVDLAPVETSSTKSDADTTDSGSPESTSTTPAAAATGTVTMTVNINGK